MAQQKLHVAIVFGGKSAEHEISVKSASNVYKAIDRSRFEVSLLGIDPQGRWHLVDGDKLIAVKPDLKAIENCSISAALPSLPAGDADPAKLNPIVIKNPALNRKIDVAFPILHGPNGEDGTVQGFLKLAGIPFVGAGVLGSAVGMDKDVMKRLLRDAGIPVVPFVVVRQHERRGLKFEDVKRLLGMPVFVKPANLGSSVGISRAEDAASFAKSVEEAFKYDTKILVEKAAVGREILCAVLGNENPKAALPGEVITAASHKFYSYEAKYLDSSAAQTVAPANLTLEQVKKIQDTSVQAFEVLCCEGMGRVDLFLTPDDTVLVNEINTLPGFTNISMYPRLWEISGLPYQDLITRLIELALERAQSEAALKTAR
ncbi:MAG: D-alanine--D-alanine ligase [Oligoflexia bacterium]|nr:D-alanine--D-alanine ligase [Oligoflexia bacterium]